MSNHDQKKILDTYSNSKYGIIVCVYCLGEGYDNPIIDAVVFAENMSSNIRILQAALRGSRKNILEPTKITKIILPILNRIDWLEDNQNSDLKKVRQVIYQMGLEDETITQKIKVFTTEIKKQSPKEPKLLKFDEYNQEITQKLRLRTIKRSILGTSFEKARKIIFDKKIKTKEEYYELCDVDNRLSKEPEIIYAEKFTNWVEYLNIENIYYDIETCKNKVLQLLTLNTHLKKDYLDLSIVCKELCKLDPLFPPNGLWVEYYNVTGIDKIITITHKKKSQGIK